MTTTDAVQNQLCSRIEELEAEKLALLEENAELAARVTELEKDAARYRWLTHQAWFQSAFDRFDPDDGGIQERFESEVGRIIDAAMQWEASHEGPRA